mmetsp:Transcript_38600/g.65932  ORF Transcript_38600/g.65932 Transcript_38600/m.65932 type:complete len:98 (+) Transcript_38600:744-1037(+)
MTSNSVVFMAKPTMVSYAMEDSLAQFVHYIPVNDDYSNVLQMVEWARRNDRQCKWISYQQLYSWKDFGLAKNQREITLIQKGTWRDLLSPIWRCIQL